MGSIKLATTGKKPTKTVDTLVPDINKLLIDLANSIKLKVSDTLSNQYTINYDTIGKSSDTIKEVLKGSQNYSMKLKKILRLTKIL